MTIYMNITAHAHYMNTVIQRHAIICTFKISKQQRDRDREGGGRGAGGGGGGGRGLPMICMVDQPRQLSSWYRAALYKSLGCLMSVEKMKCSH